MLKNIIIFVIIFLFSLSCNAKESKKETTAVPKIQNNKINWYEFDTGILKSVQEKKYVVLDVYTDWCGYCKMMDKDTYNNKDVIMRMNKNFVGIKLNPEENKSLHFQNKLYLNRDFAAVLGITGFPTTIFFTPDSKIITSIPGFISASDFSDILDYISQKCYEKNVSFKDFIKNNKKCPE